MFERDAGFEQAVASVQEDWRTVQAYEGGWVPPKGDYLCQFTDLDGGGDQTDDGVPYWWFKLVFTIREGVVDGRVFRSERYSNQSPNARRAVKTVCDQILGAENIPATDEELITALEAAAKQGLLCKVRVGERNWKSKRDPSKSGTSLTTRVLETYPDDDNTAATEPSAEGAAA